MKLRGKEPTKQYISGGQEQQSSCASPSQNLILKYFPRTQSLRAAPVPALCPGPQLTLTHSCAHSVLYVSTTQTLSQTCALS